MMGRCEGYYRTENRRCDRDATTTVARADGDYDVCEYHRRDERPVARWHGEGDRRIAQRPRLRRVA